MSNVSAVPAVNILRWNIDKATEDAAGEQSLRMLGDIPAGQFDGCNTDMATWNHRIIQPATWNDPLRSDPPHIIKQFENQHYTQGLALVVSWGGMARHPKRVYRDGSVENIA